MKKQEYSQSFQLLIPALKFLIFGEVHLIKIMKNSTPVDYLTSS